MSLLHEGKQGYVVTPNPEIVMNARENPELMQAVGEEFAARFADEAVDRVVTIESSGIAPAVMTALAMKKRRINIEDADLPKIKDPKVIVPGAKEPAGEPQDGAPTAEPQPAVTDTPPADGGQQIPE